MPDRDYPGVRGSRVADATACKRTDDAASTPQGIGGAIPKPRITAAVRVSTPSFT